MGVEGAGRVVGAGGKLYVPAPGDHQLDLDAVGHQDAEDLFVGPLPDAGNQSCGERWLALGWYTG